FEVARAYVGDSNALRTTFTTPGGTARVTDAITLDHGALLPWFELVRRVEGLDGRVRMRRRITPRFGAGESEAELAVERVRDGAVATSDGRYLVVQSFDAGEVDYTTEHVGGSLETRAGSDALISIRSAHEEPIPFARRDWLERRLADTVEDWERWLGDAGVEGPWRTATRRCALALRAMTFVPPGAIVAAPATSLPQRLGRRRALP